MQFGVLSGLVFASFYIGSIWQKSRHEFLPADILLSDHSAGQRNTPSSEIVVATNIRAGTAPTQSATRSKLLLTNDERLAWAHNAVWSDKPREQIRAIQTLVNISPHDALEVLRLMMSRTGGRNHSAVVAYGIRQLSSDNAYMDNADLKRFFNQGDLELQRVSASVLAQRGDDSLLQRYLNEQAGRLQDSDAAKRAEAIQELNVFGRHPVVAAVVVAMLQDPDSRVRLQALSSLRIIGDSNDIAAARRLRTDDIAAVRVRADEVVQALSQQSSVAGAPVNMATGNLPADL